MCMNKYQAKYRQRQQGFSLLEMMLALAIGLLVIVAVSAIFMQGKRTLNLQLQQSELQQNSIFGFSALVQELRQIQLGLERAGVVLSVNDFQLSSASVDSQLLTIAEQQSSNYNVFNDQLTIQYVPVYTEVDDNHDGMIDKIETQASDCEGTGLSATKDQGLMTKFVNVQRYFVQRVAGSSPVRYALYCDAGRYIKDENTIYGLGSNAQMLIPNVELFKVRLLVKNTEHQIQQYMDIKQYQASRASHLQIVAIELAMIARSTSKSAEPVTQDSFTLLGQNVVLKNKSDNYLREVYSQVVSIRNNSSDEQ